MEKILITGTGRCGTTFLIKLFSFLGFDTGFNETNYANFIFSNCNAGMEKHYAAKFHVLKNPQFLLQIKHIYTDKENIKIKKVIIPIRDYAESAQSRSNYGKSCGGLWNAKNSEEQISYYNKMMSNYIYIATKYDIHTLFLDFDRMVNDKTYLFEKLSDILLEKEITFDFFSEKYDKASESSKPSQIPLSTGS